MAGESPVSPGQLKALADPIENLVDQLVSPRAVGKALAGLVSHSGANNESVPCVSEALS